MKKLKSTLLSIVIFASPITYSQTMKCELNIMKASVDGLMPEASPVQLNGSQVQSGHFDPSKCSETLTSELKIILCTQENKDAVGIFEANVLIEDIHSKKDDLGFTNANVLLATARNGAKLITLNSQSGLTPHFIKKMTAAKIKFPEYQGGDSLAIDDVVEKAFKKGILVESDIVVVSLDSCEIK